MNIIMPPTWPAKLDGEALNAGVSPLQEIRQLVCDQRDAALASAEFEAAVALTHLTWWLSRLTEEVST